MPIPSLNNKANRPFLIYCGIMLVFGLVALMSASSPMAFSKFGDAYYYVKRQLLFGLFPGLILFLITAKINFSFWKKMAWPIYLFSLVLLVSVFFPGIGATINGQRSWIFLFGYSFQPAEAAKLAIIILLSALLSKEGRDWSDWKESLLPLLAVILPAILLILLQPDVGTLAIVGMIILSLFFVARIPGRYLSIMGLVCLLTFVGLVLAAPYRAERLTTFLHPELDPLGKGYQVNQAFLAVGSGGFWGLGFGHSRQKFQYLPEVANDSIFAIIAEENGFFIAAPLVVLVIFITWRGLKIAKTAADQFGSLLASGIMVWFVWQSFLNMGAMVGALPLTGVPLPFISAGGTALMIMLTSFGIVVNVSKTAKLK